MSALFVFLGAFFYAVVYTVWLKRRSWLNIVVGGLAGTCQYDIEETNMPITGATDPSTLVWGVTQANKTADLTGSCLNYSTAARLRWDSYSSGAELQFSVRQNDYNR